MNRKEARELLMQMVFQMEAQSDTGIPLMETLMEEKTIGEGQKEYLYSSFKTIVDHLDEIDSLIDKYSQSILSNTFTIIWNRWIYTLYRMCK